MAIIDYAREQAGWSQERLGEAAGVSQSQMSKLLRGDRAATFPELAGMCEGLGLKLSSVFRQAGL